MGIETAVAIAAIAGSLATVVSTVSSMGQGGSQPAATPTTATPTTPDIAQRTAEDNQRRRALAASTQNSTILTSNTGMTSSGRTVLGG